MKRQLLFAIAIISTFFGCIKYTEVWVPPNHGIANYYMNESFQYNFNVYYAKETEDYFECRMLKYFKKKNRNYEWEYDLIQTLGIDGIPKKLGKHQLYYDTTYTAFPNEKPTSRMFTFDTLGNLCEEYFINEADLANCYVEITKERNNFEEVWGTFQVSLKKVKTCETGVLPEILTIEKGEFYIKRPKP